MNDARANGWAFMKAVVLQYGVREGLSQLRRDVTEAATLDRDYTIGECDALIEATQERTI